MDNTQFAELAAWITEAGLAGQTETATLAGFCERALTFGLPLARATVLIDTLHPIYEGRVFSWNRDKKETTLTEYGRSEGEDSERWRRSPFYRLVESGEPLLRRRLTTETEAEFPILSDLRAAGMTEYVAMANRFAAEGIIGGMDCVYSSWVTDTPQGFRDDDVAALRRLLARAHGEIRLAGTYRRNPGRDVSRPRCRPASSRRPHRARRRRSNRRRPVVQRPARLHADQ